MTDAGALDGCALDELYTFVSMLMCHLDRLSDQEPLPVEYRSLKQAATWLAIGPWTFQGARRLDVYGLSTKRLCQVLEESLERLDSIAPGLSGPEAVLRARYYLERPTPESRLAEELPYLLPWA